MVLPAGAIIYVLANLIIFHNVMQSIDLTKL